LKFSKVCRQVTPWSQPVTSVCKKTAPWFGWWTCLSPVVADLLEVRPVLVVQARVVPEQVVPEQVVRVLRPQPRQPKAQAQAQAQRGHAQVVRQASPVRPLQRTPPWRDRTLA
jgi:hypothetical protein